MKNETSVTDNSQMKQGHVDPVLEVEEWKDKVDEETQNMTPDELKQYYLKALQLLTQKPAA